MLVVTAFAVVEHHVADAALVSAKSQRVSTAWPPDTASSANT